MRARENCVDFIFHSAWPGEGERKKQPQITNLHTAVSKLVHKGVKSARVKNYLGADTVSHEQVPSERIQKEEGR